MKRTTKDGIKEYHIELLQEEVNSLDNLNEICIFENAETGIKIYIYLADTIENANRQDILERYNNTEYFNPDIKTRYDSFERTEECSKCHKTIECRICGITGCLCSKWKGDQCDGCREARK